MPNIEFIFLRSRVYVLIFITGIKKGVNAPFSSGVYPFFENKKCDLLSR